MAFVAGNKDQRTFSGDCLQPEKYLFVNGHVVEHGLNQPADNGGDGADKGRRVAGCDFIDITGGFFTNLVNRYFLGFGMALHIFPQSLTGENFLPEFFMKFDDRSGDTLPVPVNSFKELPAKQQGQVIIFSIAGRDRPSLR